MLASCRISDCDLFPPFSLLPSKKNVLYFLTLLLQLKEIVNRQEAMIKLLQKQVMCLLNYSMN